MLELLMILFLKDFILLVLSHCKHRRTFYHPYQQSKEGSKNTFFHCQTLFFLFYIHTLTSFLSYILTAREVADPLNLPLFFLSYLSAIFQLNPYCKELDSIFIFIEENFWYLSILYAGQDTT